MKNHDLDLPLWGPYNKDYLGASHVANAEKGLRFDLNLFPGYYRRSVMCPRDIADCGAKIMAASADLSHFIYRYELEWKDRVYLDADFTSERDTLTIRCNFVNNTDMPESLTLNAVASMRGPSIYHNDIEQYAAAVPESCIWIDAVDYDRLNGKYIFPADGLRRGEKRVSGFVGGKAVRANSLPKDNVLVYKVITTVSDKILVRYKGEGSLILTLGGKNYDVKLPKCDTIKNHTVQIPKMEISEFSVVVEEGTADIDGFVLGCDAEKTEFAPSFDGFAPRFKSNENGGLLYFGGIEYEVKIDGAELFQRRLVADDVGLLLTSAIHNHVSKYIKGYGNREYVDFFIRPVFVAPHSEVCLTITVKARSSQSDCIGNHALSIPKCNPEGEKYMLSQRIMLATTLTNVVYPTYCCGKYIRHNTPGRNWDSLYTWDSGFIGMGLLTTDVKRAEDCLNAYMMPIGNSDAPFVFHGTPLPTQILLFWELVNKTCDKERAKKYYPYLKAQYEYFSNEKNQKESGMLSFWHLFYNSGGWDDYPTQKRLHEEKKEDSVCPVVNTAFTVLCARILSSIARLIGEDDSLFVKDIEFFSDAVNNHAWDEDSGYYGYVEHQSGGTSVYQNMGVNADMGMDGAYPYIAGISDEYRSARILDNIKKGLMTDIGVSVVDTRAPYYSRSGYWNGSVWMPHQWILWKALLDYGECDLADEIAQKALDLWEREVSATYNCYEHFMVENGRGAGFHQFSGLSTPVLMWFEAYYTPMTVTSGFRTIVTDKKTYGRNLSFKIVTDSPNAAVIVCLDEGKKYDFRCDAEVVKINKSAYWLKFNACGEFEVNAVER